jgi:hypothetical protein
MNLMILESVTYSTPEELAHIPKGDVYAAALGEPSENAGTPLPEKSETAPAVIIQM